MFLFVYAHEIFNYILVSIVLSLGSGTEAKYVYEFIVRYDTNWVLELCFSVARNHH